MKLLTCNEMKTVEAYANRNGTTYTRMMENAGYASAECIHSILHQNNTLNSNISIVVGKGNNGGDGLVIARKLFERGYYVNIVMASGFPSSEESETMYKLVQDLGIRIFWYDKDLNSTLQVIRNADYIIDCIFGFSFHGEIKENLVYLFKEINQSRGSVISIDLPSGVYCDSGDADKNCITADYTIAISSLKPAHILKPSSIFCGEISVVNIGIPAECFSKIKNTIYTLSNSEIKSLIPIRKEVSNKGDFGHLLVIAGSTNMPGACVMSTMAALRSGAGLVTCAFPESIKTIISQNVTEALLKPLKETDEGTISSESVDCILSELFKYSAILIGPGLSQNNDTFEFLKALISNSRVPMILDADALNLISSDIDILKSASCPIIITPHPKEMSRLVKKSVSEIQANRVQHAKLFAKENNIFTILKGANTVVASPSAECVYVNPTGNSGLAKGGSGDILAGILSSLIAQGISISSACTISVFIHGHCADLVADRLSKMGMLPRDLLEELSSVWSEYE